MTVKKDQRGIFSAVKKRSLSKGWRKVTKNKWPGCRGSFPDCPVIPEDASKEDAPRECKRCTLFRG